jgi:hypothetical protein
MGPPVPTDATVRFLRAACVLPAPEGTRDGHLSSDSGLKPGGCRRSWLDKWVREGRPEPPSPPQAAPSIRGRCGTPGSGSPLLLSRHARSPGSPRDARNPNPAPGPDAASPRRPSLRSAGRAVPLGTEPRPRAHGGDGDPRAQFASPTAPRAIFPRQRVHPGTSPRGTHARTVTPPEPPGDQDGSVGDTGVTGRGHFIHSPGVGGGRVPE